MNKTGAFKFRATKVGKDTALAQIVKMVQDAQNSKAHPAHGRYGFGLFCTGSDDPGCADLRNLV